MLLSPLRPLRQARRPDSTCLLTPPKPRHGPLSFSLHSAQGQLRPNWNPNLTAASLGTNASVQSTVNVLEDCMLSTDADATKPALGFGFSAGGLLFAYYVGVIMCLRDELKILTQDIPVAGASAGSLIAATAKSGISEADLVQATLDLAHNCREGGTRFRLRSVLQDTLNQVLPNDIHERCSGVVHVAVTKVWPKVTPTLVSKFTCKKDLIDTLLVSCHIPWYFDGSLVTRYDSGLAFDGGLSNFIPVPPNCQEAVRVACFPSQKLRMFKGIELSPDTFESWPHDMNQMIKWALEPAPEEMLHSLIEKGKRDARAWASASNLVSSSLVVPPQALPGSSGVIL